MVCVSGLGGVRGVRECCGGVCGVLEWYRGPVLKTNE